MARSSFPLFAVCCFACFAFGFAITADTLINDNLPFWLATTRIPVRFPSSGSLSFP